MKTQKVRFSCDVKEQETDSSKEVNKDELGFYLLRTNYEVKL